MVPPWLIYVAVSVMALMILIVCAWTLWMACELQKQHTPDNTGTGRPRARSLSTDRYQPIRV